VNPTDKGVFRSASAELAGIPRGGKVATARILVVDDEPVVLHLVSSVLERAGYEVLAAQGPPQALEIVRAPTPLDLVVTDVIMPEMCGPRLANEIKVLAPSIAVMFISGCVPSGDLPTGVPFLGKPFSAQGLLAAVERALRQKAGPREECVPERRAGQV
jgi:two-component system, cell cycle sensor histidine kinase and response regulator CckA